MNKDAGQVLGATPVGPGPGPSSMMLAKKADQGKGGIILHNAKTGAEHPLGEPSMRLVHAWGSKVVYLKRSAAGEDVAYTADVKAKPSAK